eukprot:TRINITY_DN75237_c0_g1_i1.p1 TRINITY_DN75237_c0_g1~~TRINITY_DN75237_c0_g1_i1.p1  ORF type:complete len:192 (+),score=27.24 TRINITY_DN75237_c0_g1_i1:166-741(+)
MSIISHGASSSTGRSGSSRSSAYTDASSRARSIDRYVQYKNKHAPPQVFIGLTSMFQRSKGGSASAGGSEASSGRASVKTSSQCFLEEMLNIMPPSDDVEEQRRRAQKDEEGFKAGSRGLTSFAAQYLKKRREKPMTERYAWPATDNMQYGFKEPDKDIHKSKAWGSYFRKPALRANMYRNQGVVTYKDVP